MSNIPSDWEKLSFMWSEHLRNKEILLHQIRLITCCFSYVLIISLDLTESSEVRKAAVSRLTWFLIPWCFILVQKNPIRGHLQTMWTVFWGFLTPPPPLWTNMDILGTPLPVHVDFSIAPLPLYFQNFFQKY